MFAENIEHRALNIAKSSMNRICVHLANLTNNSNLNLHRTTLREVVNQVNILGISFFDVNQHSIDCNSVDFLALDDQTFLTTGQIHNLRQRDMNMVQLVTRASVSEEGVHHI
ncbi:hypothetical protein TYRP_000475 [Tyrophagus putrescentiae]|nr:hypothetical protein TYRP_000475 [Tyrophagus putrescentiae]